MFHNIRPAVFERMRYLEEIDRRDRGDGTPHMQRLRQITPETGRFLALLLACAPQGAVIEVGASAGYSTLWLWLASAAQNRQITTFEVLPEKIQLAEETFRLTGADERIQLVHGDARQHLARFPEIAFCFLDAEKSIYADVYEQVVPRLVPGGILAADNVTSHQAELQPVIDHAAADPRVDALVVPIGKGVLVCRKA